MKKKIINTLITLVIAVLLTFLLVKLMPGDPVTILANQLKSAYGISEEEAIRRAVALLHYDPTQNVLEQFWVFVKNLFQGNLGVSIRFNMPVTEIMKAALPWTIFSAGSATLLSYYTGTKLGLFFAWSKSKKLNTAIDLIASVLGSIPDYVLAFFLISFFSVNLGWFPSRGAYDPGAEGLISFILSALYHGVLPIASVYFVSLANWVVSMRGSAVGIMDQEFIKYAKVRGLSNKTIRNKYVGKNARLPMITSLATTFGFLIGGSPLIENLFAYPGVGYYLNTAIAVRDVPLMQGMFFMIIVAVIFSNLLVEILYTYLDPRLRKVK